MENLTKDENYTTDQQPYNCTTLNFEVHLKIFISALNIPLSVIAFLGNILIIVALQKPSSLRPPSKLLFGCLSGTDLFVGLITQPLYVTYLMSTEHSKSCFYSVTLFLTMGLIFCGVSLLTMTAISVDRLLALILGMRYKQVITLRRVRILVASFWLLCASIPFIPRASLVSAHVILISCIVISTFCYFKIYFTLRHHHQTQVQDIVHQGRPNGKGISLNIARYKKTVSSALWVQITLLVCYLPLFLHTVVSVIVVSIARTPSFEFSGALAVTFFLSNSSLNPFLYCWKVREVRRAVKDTIRQFSCFLR